jgi:hypothetical protein
MTLAAREERVDQRSAVGVSKLYERQLYRTRLKKIKPKNK